MNSILSSRKKEKGIFITLAVSIALVSVVLGLLKLTGFDTQVIHFLEWVRNSGTPGQVVFFIVVAMTVVLLLPAVMLTMAAGYLYGVVGGSIIIVFAETLGALVAFTVARQLQKHYELGFLHRRNVLEKWENALASHGWRIIAILRMIPFFPFKLSNYYFGLTPVTTRNYLVGTLVGLWPISVFNVYLGSIAGDLMSLGNSSSQRTPFQWFIYLFGFLVVAVIVLALLKYAQRRVPE